MTVIEHIKAYCKAWRKRNYSQMYSLCSRTWCLKNSKGTIESLVFEKELTDFTIIEDVDMRSETHAEVLARFQINGTWGKWNHVRLSKENKPFSPSITGTWGLVPETLMK